MTDIKFDVEEPDEFKWGYRLYSNMGQEDIFVSHLAKSQATLEAIFFSLFFYISYIYI